MTRFVTQTGVNSCWLRRPERPMAGLLTPGDGRVHAIAQPFKPQVQGFELTELSELVRHHACSGQRAAPMSHARANGYKWSICTMVAAALRNSIRRPVYGST